MAGTYCSDKHFVGVNKMLANQGHEFVSARGFLEKRAGQLTGDRPGVVLLNSAHRHAQMLSADDDAHPGRV